ncbi:MAG: hypothetical protein ACYCOX_01540 [Acidobacteriaceae bacterium]
MFCFRTGDEGKKYLPAPQDATGKVGFTIIPVPSGGTVPGKSGIPGLFLAPWWEVDVPFVRNTDTRPDTELQTPSFRQVVEESVDSLVDLTDCFVRFQIEADAGKAEHESITSSCSVDDTVFLSPEVE